MTKYDWIRLKYDVQPNIMICERCNNSQVMPEGFINIAIMQSLTNTFIKLHKNCEKK